MQDFFQEEKQSPENSDEEYDSPLILISSKYWAALGCFAVLFLITLFYIFFGSIPVRVEGKGLVFNPGAVFTVVAPSSGVVERVVAFWGEKVAAGTVVAEMLFPRESVKTEEEGSVLEIEVNPGQRVFRGEILLWLQRPLKEGEPRQVTALIPSPAIEQVQVGMEARISPLIVDATRYGHLIGKVSMILPFWTSRAKNLFPIQYLLKNVESPVFTHLVVIDLLEDTESPGQHHWSSGKGPPFSIQLGTPCKVSILTERKKPFSYLFP